MIEYLYRQSKISNELKKKISNILQQNISDPRINKFITVTDLLISKDLSFAKIFIMLPYKEEINNNFKKTICYLNNITGYIRYILKKKIILRSIPKLIFLPDFSLEKGKYISNIINNITKKNI
ncbi:30S ribosome-binding factor RbfA [Enterobacteriaceae endosymbiont of Plateumaris consimilis]|uniref:30S ribosome-binding factor RbfA n=1 Tax=Enterobacteriaceae endosymbiont of Plateumaris consimilis TaxID=2675794 RepID=UPI001449ECF6|nr:30S ribosome-binding factor RbfA [Enterobacteriaceae endosymbiont of Plateumaris consimilis]QJC28715.1 30S ribosome-binding factor RbfA [Enterobacteriaceae endosymbiont of Plateumaris consimilis]